MGFFRGAFRTQKPAFHTKVSIIGCFSVLFVIVLSLFIERRVLVYNTKFISVIYFFTYKK